MGGGGGPRIVLALSRNKKINKVNKVKSILSHRLKVKKMYALSTFHRDHGKSIKILM